jgi:hypothetical protein
MKTLMNIVEEAHNSSGYYMVLFMNIKITQMNQDSPLGEKDSFCTFLNFATF